jgi:hypothetical protein
VHVVEGAAVFKPRDKPACHLDLDLDLDLALHLGITESLFRTLRRAFIWGPRGLETRMTRVCDL